MVEIVFYDVIEMPENAVRAKYCSKELTNRDAPVDGNISRLTFFVDDSMIIHFTSERRFTTGRLIYAGRTYTEKSIIKIINQGSFFAIQGLCKMSSRNKEKYSAEIHLPSGIIFLSDMALQQLREGINAAHKDVLSPMQKAEQEKCEKEKAAQEIAAMEKAANKKRQERRRKQNKRHG